MTDVEKAAKRHCWSTASLADAYEAGFAVGAAWQRERVYKAIENSALISVDGKPSLSALLEALAS